MKGFYNSHEIKTWFKDHYYYTPIVTERKRNWRLRWNNKGNIEIANQMAKRLREEGYDVFDVYGSANTAIKGPIYMEIVMGKSEVKTDVDIIRNIISRNLKLGMPSVRETYNKYTLYWNSIDACEEGLNHKVDVLKTKFTVIAYRLVYSTIGSKEPMGYQVTISKTDYLG